MSKILLVILFACVVPIFARGQIYWGIKGLIGVSNIDYSDVAVIVGSDGRIALQGGGFVGFKTGVAVGFGIQGEAYYSSENSVTTYLAMAGVESQFNTNIRSVYIPVLARISFFPEDLAQLGVFAGPSMRYVVKAEQSQENEMYALPPIPNANDVLWGVTVGLDLWLFRNLILDLRYNHGLSEVYDQLENEATGASSSSSTLTFGVGVRFN